MDYWRTCSVVGCTNRGQLTRGWCQSHYSRWTKTGDVQADVPLQRKTVKGLKWCTIEGCPRPHLSRGWCSTHYMRWKTTGDPGTAELLRTPGDPSLKEKACRACGQVKPKSEFHAESRTRDGKGSYCKACFAVRQRDVTIRRKYGITSVQYDAMVVAQAGKCAACNEPAKLVIDHCHKSGKVRALLCDRCNRLLGVADDRIELLQAAIAFLGVHKEA